MGVRVGWGREWAHVYIILPNPLDHTYHSQYSGGDGGGAGGGQGWGLGGMWVGDVGMCGVDGRGDGWDRGMVGGVWNMRGAESRGGGVG